MHMPVQRSAASLEQNHAATTSEHDVDTGPEHNELTDTLTAAPPRKPGVGLRVLEGSVETAAVGLPGTVRASERPQWHSTTHHERAVAFLVVEEKKPVRTQPRTSQQRVRVDNVLPLTTMAFLVSLIKPFAYISVPALILRSTSPTARYYVNFGIYVGTMVVVSAWGAVVGVTMLATGQAIDLNHFVARSFYALAGPLLDINIEVEGEEHLQTCPALLMGNHQSMLDILMLGRCALFSIHSHRFTQQWDPCSIRVFPRHSTIMAKKELRWSPLGPFMGLAGALFVDRGNSASAIRSLEEAGETMKRRRTSLWIFPEGTRSSSERPTMLPLKKGGFHLAVQAQLPITPVVTENYWRIYHFGVFNGGTIKIRGACRPNVVASDCPEMPLCKSYPRFQRPA